MPIKAKVAKKDKRPIIKLMCENCKDYVKNSRKNPTNTPDRMNLVKYCPRCRGRHAFKETK
jgi:large subunit ribosomal protein L33